jgi:hypothetical protein
MPIEITGTDEQRAAMFAALVEAQSNMEGVKKASSNPHFRSKYADLAAVIEATVPALNAAGLCVMQMPGMDEDGVTLTTIIGHAGSGAFIQSTACSPAAKDNPQGVGSTITYLRRYSLQAAVALPAEDDDGNAGSAPRARQERGQPRGGGQGSPAHQPAGKGQQRPSTGPMRGATGHDPSWEGDRVRFIGTLKGMDLEYDAIASWLESRGSGRPSEWTTQRRAQFIGALGGGLKDEFLKWSEGGGE